MLLEARDAEHKMTTPRSASICLIDENGERRVRMGNLAFVGAHSINGVVGDALRADEGRRSSRTCTGCIPDRINNKTNGITPRRWLMQCNPGLTALDPRRHRRPASSTTSTRCATLEPFADDAGFQDAFARGEAAQQGPAGASWSRDRMGIRLDPNALFDIQVKRIHEYKRQLLNIIETVALYDQIRSHPEHELGAAGEDLRRQGGAELPQRQADHQARQRRGAGRSTRDPTVRGVLKVVFVPNYNVSLAE